MKIDSEIAISLEVLGCLRADHEQAGSNPKVRLATNRGLALLWFALQRLANRQQEDGTLVFRMRRKELNYIIVEEGQPGRTQVLGIRSQVDPAADDACLQLDGPIAAVPVSLQNAFQ